MVCVQQVEHGEESNRSSRNLFVNRSFKYVKASLDLE